MASPPAWSMGTSKRSTSFLKRLTNLLQALTGKAVVSQVQANILLDLHINNLPQVGGIYLFNLFLFLRLGTANRSVDHRSDTPGPGSYNSPGKIVTDIY